MSLVNNQSAIVEIGSSKLVCIIGYLKNGKKVIAGSAVLPFDCAIEGMWKGKRFEAALRNVIETASAMAGIKIKKVSVGVPGAFCNVALSNASINIESDDGLISERDVARLAEEAQLKIVPEGFEVLHCLPTVYRIDGQNTLNPIGNKGNVLFGSMSVIFAEKAFLNSIATSFMKAGIGIEHFIASPLGIGLMAIPPHERDDVAILVDTGHYTTDVTVFKGDGIFYHSVVQLGGYDITVALSKRLDIDLDLAEQLKKRYVYGLASNDDTSYDIVRLKNGRIKKFPHDDVRVIIENLNVDILAYVKEKLDEAEINLHSKMRIYFCGGAMSLNAGSMAFIKDSIGRDVKFIRQHQPGMASIDTSTAEGILDYSMKMDDNRNNGFLKKLLGK